MDIRNAMNKIETVGNTMSILVGNHGILIEQPDAVAKSLRRSARELLRAAYELDGNASGAHDQRSIFYKLEIDL